MPFPTFRNSLRCIATVLLALSPFQAITEQSKRTLEKAPRHSELPFFVGEELTYEASWSKFLVAGELKLNVKDRRAFAGVEGYHLSIQAQSTGMVRTLIYQLNDSYNSYVNTNTLLPFHVENQLERGNEREHVSIEIDQKRNVAKQDNGVTLKIPPETYDLASLVYAIRTSDLSPGKARRFTLLGEGQVYSVSAEAESNQEVSTRAATRQAVRIAIKQVEGGQIKDPYKLRLYLSNDVRRLPLLVTAEPQWGQVRVELTAAKGNRPL